MRLSDLAVRNAAPKEKDYKLQDERGLYVLIAKAGGKLWRLKFRVDGKEQTLSFGKYPEVSLKDAREKRDEARRLLSEGHDLRVVKQRNKVQAQIAKANTFSAVAMELIEKWEEERAEATVKKNRWYLSQLEPAIGKRPIAEIEPMELLPVLKLIEKQGKRETAKRARAFAARVFKYAVITGRAKINAAADLGSALVAPKVKHHAAILDPEQFGALLRAIGGYKTDTVRLALRLAANVFVRPGELRQAEWSEFDLEKRTWTIPAERMKMRVKHVVPLSSQVLALLEEARPSKLVSKYVFPSPQTWLKPLSENTLNKALRSLGFTKDEMTTHGFRSTASTLLNESGLWSPDAIERALAHADSNKIRGTYHRGAHWEERVRMAQWWSDYLDTLLEQSGVEDEGECRVAAS